MNFYKTTAIILGILFMAQLGSAQSIGYYSQATALTVRQHIQRQELRSSINRQRLRNRTLRRSGKARSTRPPRKLVAVGPSAFSFKNPLLPAKFYREYQGSPAEKRAGQTLLTSLWNRYEKVARDDGFPSNDLAYTFNYFLINNYIVYAHHYDKNRTARRITANGQRETDTAYRERLAVKINIPVEAKIYQQYRTFLSSDANIKKMTNEQKQLLAELLATMTNMAFKMYDDGYLSNDPKKLRVASEAARSNLETLFGVPAEKIKITEDGVSFAH